MNVLLNAIFGGCMGAVIIRLAMEKDYVHAVIAVAAFVIYLLKIAGVW